MDLTFTDTSFNDIGILDIASGDFAYGSDENTFDLILSDTSGVPDVGALVYDDSGTIGGVVRGYQSEYETGLLHVTGDTWTGLLNSSVIIPSGDYFSVSGTLESCIVALIANLGLTWLFSVSDETYDVNISHTFKGSRDADQTDTGRYMGGWSALWQMLLDNSLKAVFKWEPTQKKIVITGLQRVSYTDDETIQAGLANVNVSNSQPVNHLVCLGQGDLAARTVVHLYSDASGNVSTTQSITGIGHIADVYDDSSAATAAELTTKGTAKLKDLFADSQTVTIGVEDEATEYDLGDVVGGTDDKTGVSAQATITKKIISMSGAATSVRYESSVRS